MMDFKEDKDLNFSLVDDPYVQKIRLTKISGNVFKNKKRNFSIYSNTKIQQNKTFFHNKRGSEQISKLT